MCGRGGWVLFLRRKVYTFIGAVSGGQLLADSPTIGPKSRKIGISLDWTLLVYLIAFVNPGCRLYMLKQCGKNWLVVRCVGRARGRKILWLLMFWNLRVRLVVYWCWRIFLFQHFFACEMPIGDLAGFSRQVAEHWDDFLTYIVDSREGIDVTGHNANTVERDLATDRTLRARFALIASIAKIINYVTWWHAQCWRVVESRLLKMLY